MFTYVVQRTLSSSSRIINNARLLSISQQRFNLDPDVRSRIKKLVDSNDVVLFMKGTPEEPMCGFSRNAKKVGYSINLRISLNCDHALSFRFSNFTAWLSRHTTC